jgi:hypothetical protein
MIPQTQYIFMALDHGVADIELALTIDQHKTSADFSVNIVIVIFEHLLRRACVGFLLLKHVIRHKAHECKFAQYCSYYGLLLIKIFALYLKVLLLIGLLIPNIIGIKHTGHKTAYSFSK